MSAARGVGLKAVADLLAKAAGLITFPVIARYAGPEGYGALGQVTTVAAFLFPFATLGLTGVTTRFFSALEWSREARERMLRLTLLVGLLSGLGSLVLAGAAPLLNRHILGWEHGTALFRWGSLGVLAMALEYLLLDFLRSRQWYIQYSLVQIAQTVLLVGAALYFLPAGYGVVGFLKASLAVKLLVTGVFYAGLWGWSAPQNGPRAGTAAVATTATMIRFGLPLAVSSLGVWFMHLGDRVVIGHFLSPEALGLYGAVYAFSMLLAGVNAPLTVPYYPRLMRRVAAGDPAGIAGEVRVYQRFSLLAVVPASAFLIAVFGPLLGVMGGPAFAVGLPLVVLIVLANASEQLSTTAYYVLYCKDKVKFMQTVILGAGLLNLAGNFLFVPRFGLLGAAAVTLATFLLMDGALHVKANSLVPVFRWYRFDVAWKALAASFAGVVPVVIIGRLTEPAVAPLLAAGAAFLAVYAGALAVLGEVKRSDFELLARAAFLKR